jgi:hypothetical protein
MRIGRALPFLFITLAACNRGDSFAGDVDTALLHRAGGDVMLDDGGKISYEITSERYRRWEAARRALRAERISLSMRLGETRNESRARPRKRGSVPTR